MRQVRLHRPFTEEECGGDLPIRTPLGDEVGDGLVESDTLN